ncbi:GntR family transcriptional regulator [Falsiroseomonas oryziterrae]|uniref:GntR family transcriptional regulator n=1 Tax=Falsiroseomonas oryziterrae TaxID=2911368 RepID=UPI001F46B46A|nr:GntR family transcriptional regulator [Roseomonas sp. NPKOSM-4]
MSMPRESEEDERSGVSRAERVYRLLREGIRTGAYRPGQRLREVQLAEELATSRTPVREAIRRLEADRLVESLPGRGYAVTQLDEARIRELYQFRAALEGAAAELAALQATDLDIATLDATLDAMRAASDDAARAAALNRRFHQAIYDAARNVFLNQAIQAMSDVMALLPGTTYRKPGRVAQVVMEHEAVLGAIRRRDPVAASTAMRAHIHAAGQFRVCMTLAGDG